MLHQLIRNGPTTRGFDHDSGSDLRFFASFVLVENECFVDTELF